MATTTEITAGSELLRMLATITNRDEAGRHFTERYSDETLDALEALGMIEIDRPVHAPTGIDYDRQYWHLSVTELGQETVNDLYDDRDYATDED